MPIIKSAKKRVRVAQKANDRNKETKTSLRKAMKQFVASLKSGKGVHEAQSEVQSAIDTAVKKGIMHKNKASRKKAQLAKAVSSTGAKPAAKTKPVAAKSATKKPAAKKAPAKKPATKKK